MLIIDGSSYMRDVIKVFSDKLGIVGGKEGFPKTS
jgi:hypothetical protein